MPAARLTRSLAASLAKRWAATPFAAFAITLLAAGLMAPSAASAYDRNDPIGLARSGAVHTLSAGQIWDGPSIEGVTGWDSDPAQGKLIATLSSRRVPQNEAVEALKAYSASVSDAERSAKLTQLSFAGLLATVNADRGTVIAGIIRFEQRQRGRAKELEREGTHIAELKSKADTDPKAKADLDNAQQLYDWNVRVYQERQGLTPIACEIPVLMESRIFEMARAIRSLMPS